MNRIAIFIASIVYITGYAQEDVIFKAMEDELKRTTTKLKIGEKPLPYYVAYRIKDYEELNIEGYFGAIRDTSYERKRRLFIDLRVGNYKLDNSNFVSIEGGPFIMDYYEEKIGFRLPIEDNYDAIRHALWINTDKVYKTALDNLSKKTATLEHRKIKDRPDDFSKAEKFSLIEPVVKLEINKKDWIDKVEKLSRVFKKFPKIQSGWVEFNAKTENQYLVNSEGTKVRKGSKLVCIDVFAETQTKDGVKIYDGIRFCGKRVEDLPKVEEMVKKITSMAETLSIIAESEEKEEEYCGPVAFVGEAACQLFYEIIGRGISNPRKPLYEQEQMAMVFKKMGGNEGFLAGKLGKKILPKNFRVYDDPTCDKWNGITLVGNYSVDDEGVEPQKIEIVKNGKLVNLPMSRTPTKKLKKSNGHGRGEERVVSRISNLFIESKETVEDIEKELINLCKEEDLEYGIIISKLYKEEFLPIEEVEATIMSFLFGKKDEEKSLISDPIYAYKIYKDGRKELIGRIKLEEFGVSKLKDIVAVGSESYVYNSFVIVDLFGVKMKGVPISVIAPSIIIKEVDVTSKEGKGEELPLILHPYFEKK